LEEIITFNNDVLQDFESDMALEIRKRGNLTREPVESNVTAKQTPGSQILTPLLPENKSDL